MDGRQHRFSSTEVTGISVKENKREGQKLRVGLSCSRPEESVPDLEVGIEIWSYNEPIMLVRYTASNVSTKTIEDMKLWNFMDFDIGGASSYNDDFGSFETATRTLHVWDNSPLHVLMDSRPGPRAWEISTPTRMKLDDSRGQLENNTQAGPMDIATGLQWNLGNMSPSKSHSVELVLASAVKLDEARALIPKAWELFTRTMGR